MLAVIRYSNIVITIRYTTNVLKPLNNHSHTKSRLMFIYAMQ